MTPRLRRASLVLLPALAGCATHADLVQQERQVRGLIQEKGRQIEQLQREVERLRADVEEGGGHKHGAAADERLNAIEQRLAALEHGAPPPTAPEAQPVSPPSTTPPPAAAAKPAPAPAEDDEWRREIAREQSAAGTVNVPERADYLTMLDGLARKDCARAIPQLNSFATNHRDSPLADNALYWAARCYAATGKQNEAISKFYDVTLKYPKGDRAAAALWAQGNLFLEMGDTPDARINFSKLIRDYPSSDEAARARQKLMELEH
ncbi:MAG: tetratricopeptide repeat protein [Deltaproteobacteria bacterium]|nr:MAG: tetratricopeptide repeat protein [Deltaproteobacteria bacterium]